MHNSLTYIFVHDFTNSLSSISTMSETNIIFRILFHSNGPYSTQTYFHAIFVLFGSADLLICCHDCFVRTTFQGEYDNFFQDVSEKKCCSFLT